MCKLSIFQFHKGAIETEEHLPVMSFDNRFQFHKGAIETVRVQTGIAAITTFNSIKVRLKPSSMSAPSLLI